METEVAITGAADGLGRVIATTMLAHGRAVVLLDRDGERVHETAGELGARYSVEVPVVVADLATIDGIDLAADQLIANHRIGALVNNAGGWLPGPQYPDAAGVDWLSALTLNLIAPMLLTQRLWPTLSAVLGAVVNIGSSGGLGDDPYGSPEYGAAKAGVRRFTASLGSQQAVRVMAVVPGWIGLHRAHREWAALPVDRQRDLGALIPPVDIANTVVSLLDHGRAGEVVEMLNTDYRPTSGE